MSLQSTTEVPTTLQFPRTFSEDKRILRLAELGFAMVMRIVPRRYRADAAFRIARVSVPLFRHTVAYREQRFHCPREIALHLILNALTKNSTLFDPGIEVNGYDYFERAYEQGQGVLVVGHHAALTVLMVRLFYDHGLNPIVITPDRCMRVPGTLVKARTLQPSAMFLVNLRNRLRHGELVCAMPDRAEHHAGRTIDFSTAAGRVIFAPAMIHLAARSGAQILFVEVRAKNRRLVATIASPSPSSIGNAAAITEDFISFVRECTAFGPRPNGPQINVIGSQPAVLSDSKSAGEPALATPQID